MSSWCERSTLRFFFARDNIEAGWWFGCYLFSNSLGNLINFIIPTDEVIYFSEGWLQHTEKLDLEHSEPQYTTEIDDLKKLRFPKS